MMIRNKTMKRMLPHKTNRNSNKNSNKNKNIIKIHNNEIKKIRIYEHRQVDVFKMNINYNKELDGIEQVC